MVSYSFGSNRGHLHDLPVTYERNHPMQIDLLEPVHVANNEGSFSLDPHLPDYFMLRLAGVVDDSLLRQYRQAVVTLYGKLILANQAHCPVILDYAELSLSNWTLPRFIQAHSGIFKRNHRFVAVKVRDVSQIGLTQAFISWGTILYPNTTICATFEEAVQSVMQNKVPTALEAK
jgi:hypothetical protein